MMDLAACKDMPTEVFFPGPGQGYETARKVCNRCPVRNACLHLALASEAMWAPQGGNARDARHGMFGGTTPDERTAMSWLWNIYEKAAA